LTVRTLALSSKMSECTGVAAPSGMNDEVMEAGAD